MKYTLWFYAYNDNCDKLVRQYDVYTGTRYQCYKLRASMSFSWQYKVFKSIW